MVGIWSVLILIANKYLHNQTIMFTDLKFFYRKSFTTNMLCKHSTTYLSKVYIYNTYDICTFHLQFWNFWVLCSGLQGKILKYSRLNKKKVKGYEHFFLHQTRIGTIRPKNQSCEWAFIFTSYSQLQSDDFQRQL